MEENNNADLVALITELAAKIAIQEYEKRRQIEIKENKDNRLRNTKLLLKNYRIFKNHSFNAVYELDENESGDAFFYELMSPGKNIDVIIESIKTSAARTKIMINHIDVMLNLYHTYCFAFGGPEEQRRWRIINELYIRDIGDGSPASVQEIAIDENVTERTIYKDIELAIKKISVFLFGVDSIDLNKGV